MFGQNLADRVISAPTFTTKSPEKNGSAEKEVSNSEDSLTEPVLSPPSDVKTPGKLVLFF